MDHVEAGSSGRPRRSLRLSLVLAITLALGSGFAVAGCTQSSMEMAGGTADAQATTSAPEPASHAPAAYGGAAGVDMTPADAQAAWDARPAFVNTTSAVRDAYAFALYNPQFVEWMPCYCGCGAIGHRSNLDCYLKKTAPGRPTQFEEHASYCDICVQITLTTKQLVGQGRSLHEIRQVIDETFGGSVPGTPTELPPA